MENLVSIVMDYGKLITGRKFEASYRKFAFESGGWRQLFPLGLIIDGILYLPYVF